MGRYKCDPKCRGDCCGLVPFTRAHLKRFDDKKCKPILELMEFQDKRVVPITSDYTCPFLDNEGRCAIYNWRPKVCRIIGSSVPCHRQVPEDEYNKMHDKWMDDIKRRAEATIQARRRKVIPPGFDKGI